MTQISTMPVLGTLPTGGYFVPVVQSGVAVNYSFDLGAWQAALSASGGSALVGFQQSGTGAVSRTAQAKLRDTVSITDFPGVDPTGTTDSTAGIQAALNSGAMAVFIPAGSYKFSAVTMPTTIGFTLFGNGPSSKLIQTGTGIAWPTKATLVWDIRQTIRDFSITGTAGTGHSLDTTYLQSSDIRNILITDIPVGFAALRLNGNPTDGTIAHDMRVKNFRVYSATAGNAGIHIGAYHADCMIDGFQMNGSFAANYCLLVDIGATTTSVSNSHPYNAKINVVRLSGSNNYFGWDFVTFDNSLQDNFVSIGSSNGRFTNCFVEAIAPTYSGIVFNNSSNNTLYGTTFAKSSVAGAAAACVTETSGATGNRLLGGSVDNLASYTTPFNLTGATSVATGFPGDSNYGSIYNLVGVAAAAQAQNTTTNYGPNGSGSVLNNTAFPAPIAGAVLFAKVTTDFAPAGGQTFTFNLQKNGTTIGSAVQSSGFTSSIVLSPPVAVSVGDQLSIQSVFSATSGSASPRYSITLKG